MGEDVQIGKEWHVVKRGWSDIAQQLSGIMVLEMAEKLEKERGCR